LSSARNWEVDFVAVSNALGEPITAVEEALGEEGLRRAQPLARSLQGATKQGRALALATALAEVLTDLERMQLQEERP